MKLFTNQIKPYQNYQKKDGCRPCAREVGQNRPNYYLKELLPIFRKVEPRLVVPQRFVVDDVSRHKNSVNLSYHPRVHHMLQEGPQLLCRDGPHRRGRVLSEGEAELAPACTLGDYPSFLILGLVKADDADDDTLYLCSLGLRLEGVAGVEFHRLLSNLCFVER